MTALEVKQDISISYLHLKFDFFSDGYTLSNDKKFQKNFHIIARFANMVLLTFVFSFILNGTTRKFYLHDPIFLILTMLLF